MKHYKSSRLFSLTYRSFITTLSFVSLSLFSISSAIASNNNGQGNDVLVEGEVTVVHIDDMKNHRSKHLYTLEDKDNNQKFNLKFEDEPPKFLYSGSKIKVHGKVNGNEIIVGANSNGTNNVETVAYANSSITGEQNTIVLIADFKDVSVPCSAQSIDDLMFSDPNLKSLNDFYQKNSLGQVSFAGQVAGPYQINYSSTDACDFNTWASAAEAKATADGIDLTNYNRRVYVMPKNNCNGDGLGTIGGNPSKAWVFYCDIPSLYGHEIGHNLYMDHASTFLSEYGDHSDVMGLVNGWAHFNAPHQEQMGWMPQEQIVPINQPGIYEISPIEEDPSVSLSPQILKIAKPDSNEFYYLSYRRAIDSFSSLEFKYRDQTSIHQYKGDSSSTNTYFHDALADGEVFTDTVNGITITQLSHTADYATVEIQFDSNCSASAPNLSLSPATQNGAAGMTLEYQVTISNTDSVHCSPSTFELDQVVPDGWSGDIVPNTITLSPGTKATTTLSLTSGSSSLDGDYTATVHVFDNWNSSHDQSGNVNYTVITDTQPPSAPASISATEKRRNIQLSWSDSTDNVAVVGYTVWKNSSPIADVIDTNFSDTDIASGSIYDYYITAYDEWGNESNPSATVTVSTGGGNGGGKGKNK